MLRDNKTIWFPLFILEPQKLCNCFLSYIRHSLYRCHEVDSAGPYITISTCSVILKVACGLVDHFCSITEYFFPLPKLLLPEHKFTIRQIQDVSTKLLSFLMMFVYREFSIGHPIILYTVFLFGNKILYNPCYLIVSFNSFSFLLLQGFK